jgi:hypothetical protein
MTPFVHAPLSGPRSPFFAVRQAGGAARSPLAALAADDVRARPSPSANTRALQAPSEAAGSAAAGATRKRARASASAPGTRVSLPRTQKAAGLAAALQAARAEEDGSEAQRCPALPGKRRSSSEAVALAKKQRPEGPEAMALTKEQAQAVRAALADEARQQKAQAKAHAKAAATAAKEAATRERLVAKLVKGAVAAVLRRVRADAKAHAKAFEVACKAGAARVAKAAVAGVLAAVRRTPPSAATSTGSDAAVLTLLRCAALSPKPTSMQAAAHPHPLTAAVCSQGGCVRLH